MAHEITQLSPTDNAPTARVELKASHRRIRIVVDLPTPLLLRVLSYVGGAGVLGTALYRLLGGP